MQILIDIANAASSVVLFFYQVCMILLNTNENDQGLRLMLAQLLSAICTASLITIPLSILVFFCYRQCVSKSLRESKEDFVDVVMSESSLET